MATGVVEEQKPLEPGRSKVDWSQGQESRGLIAGSVMLLAASEEAAERDGNKPVQ